MQEFEFMHKNKHIRSNNNLTYSIQGYIFF